MLGKARIAREQERKAKQVQDPDLIDPEYGLSWVEVLRDVRKAASSPSNPSALKLSGREAFVKWESYLKPSVMIHPLVLDHLIGHEHCPNHEKGIKATSKWNANLDRHLASTIACTLVGAPLITWIYFQQTRDPSDLYGSGLMEVLKDRYYSSNKNLKSLISNEIKTFKQNQNESVQSYQSRFELLYIKALDHQVMWFEHDQFKAVLQGVETPKFQNVKDSLRDHFPEKNGIQAVFDYGKVDNQVDVIFNTMREKEVREASDTSDP